MKRELSPEARAKMSAARKGHKDSPETLARRKEAMSCPTVKAKMSAVQIGNKNAAGHHVSVEGRAKMSVAHHGLKASPETRGKMSVAQTGRTFSPETRVKLSVAVWRGGPKIYNAKRHAKRRTLGFVPLNEPFVGCEGHHVDNEQVIHLPKTLHQSVRHNHNTGKGMAQMNAIAYNFLFKQEVTAALAAKEMIRAK